MHCAVRGVRKQRSLESGSVEGGKLIFFVHMMFA